MMDGETRVGVDVPRVPLFATTHWTVVVNAGDERSPRHESAMVELCRGYWYPLYAYARRRGTAPHDAQDLVQGFFADLLARNYLDRANPARGKFRWFLLGSFRNYLANERERVQAAKRGGGCEQVSWEAMDAETRYGVEPAGVETPERLYDQAWALTLLGRVRARVREHYTALGKVERFEVLECFLPGASPGLSQAEAAARSGVSEGALRVELHRLRAVFKQLLRAEVAHTVSNSGEIEEELRALLEALAG